MNNLANRPIFLKAEWRKLAMANYAVDPKILEPYLPFKTELDSWNGHCYVSLVGFMFTDVAIKGIKVPFHTRFEEVNLRFYVRHNDNGNWKRGVVFIKEIVPKFALAFVANTVYGENYERLPMLHRWETENDNLCVSYQWKKAGKWHGIGVQTGRNPQPILSGSEADPSDSELAQQFITEHYWGYTKINDFRTSEYAVEHPRWDVYDVIDYNIDVDFGSVYGNDFAFLNGEKPLSVFLAEGSEILVRGGRSL